VINLVKFSNGPSVRFRASASGVQYGIVQQKALLHQPSSSYRVTAAASTYIDHCCCCCCL